MGMVYKFDAQQVALVFIAPIVGSLLAAITTILLDRVMARREMRKHNGMIVDFEYRLWPAIIGAPAVMASMFWIGFTAKPTDSFYSPIAGTVFYVWGNLSILVSFRYDSQIVSFILTG